MEKLVIATEKFLERFDQLVLCRDAREVDKHLKEAYSNLREALRQEK